ncbi:MAG TPA: hypothetical protein VIO61_00615 [Anaerolineaceae bacterium]
MTTLPNFYRVAIWKSKGVVIQPIRDIHEGSVAFEIPFEDELHHLRVDWVNNQAFSIGFIRGTIFRAIIFPIRFQTFGAQPAAVS